MPRPDGPSFEPIAVVGQACVLPGALSPDELWSAVAAGRDLTSTAPDGRWGLPRSLALAQAQSGQAPQRSPDRAWHDRGGYVRGFEEVFDPEGFALPATEIQGLDPLFQWVLHAGREALRDAGEGGAVERTGVVLGNLSFPSVGASAFAESVWQGGKNLADPRNHFSSGLPAHLLARALGLGGDAFALDAACASSLVAVKLACDRLHDGTADAMLAGAVSCADDLFIHVGFCALEALSPSGLSRPFHRDADGLLPAEGAVFVVLRRLADAAARGDRILGVIRGVGLSNDGRGGGLLAPSEEGQGRAIRAAYQQAGVAPGEVSLVECHATGTRVGDAAEIRSLGDLYQGQENVPIGSLKSNLGHLITAAGLAGLLKVLAAIRTRTRPPTLHADRLNPVLDDSPFRVLTAPEPWPSDGPRKAAISAFGFGGNNAHLLVEEWTPTKLDGAPPARRAVGTAVPVTRQQTPAPIAIVGLAATTGSGATDAFARVLFSGESRLQASRIEQVELSLEGLGFPPNDLKQTLPQQLLLLATARHAIDGLGSELPRARTGVLIGMRCDAEIARWGLRWRLGAGYDDADPEPLQAARDGVIAGLQAAGVVGTMPNMTANRLNHQLDLGGASASVSSEELSGLTALDLAARALRSKELDAALVGAADLCCEPVHEAAVRALIGDRAPGDAAVVLVLKRLEDARRDGDRVFAVVEGEMERGGEGDGLRLVSEVSTSRLDLSGQVGHSHAASGLLHVAAAALACHHRTIPAGLSGAGSAGVPPAKGAESAGPVPWLSGGVRQADVTTTAFEGRSAKVRLRDDPDSARGSLAPAGGSPRICLYSGTDRAEVRSRLTADRQDDPAGDRAPGPARLALVAGDDAKLAERREQALRLLAGETSGNDRGVYFREAPIGGELAFVFTGAGAAYRGMGRELLLAMPGLLDRLDRRMGDLPATAGWVYDPDRVGAPQPLEQLWGSSFLTQAHVELTRGELGLAPTAVLGYSSGESNSLMAMGAWNDLDALHRDTIECGLFTTELGGDFAAVGRAWNAGDGAGVDWANWVLSAPAAQVREALAGEDTVHLTLISSPEDSCIGGDAAACRRVIDVLGVAAYPLGYDLAVHCPVVDEVADRWLELHRRETTGVPGVRFYSHSILDHYRPTRETAARAILGQAVKTLDFPALVKRAFDDGVRIFLEHGPRGLCSGWIRKTLASHGVAAGDYLAVSLDHAGGSSLRHTTGTVAQLLVAGVELQWEMFHRPVATSRAASKTLTFPAHWPPVKLPESFPKRPPATEQPIMTTLDNPQLMPLAPSLPSVLGDHLAPGLACAPPARPTPVAEVVTEAPATPVDVTPIAEPAIAKPVAEAPATSLVAGPATPSVTTASIEAAAPPPPVVIPTGDPVRSAVLAGLSDLQARVGAAHREYLGSQTALHQQFLALRQKALSDLLRAQASWPSQTRVETPELSGQPRVDPPELPGQPRVEIPQLPPSGGTDGQVLSSLTGRQTSPSVDLGPLPPTSIPEPAAERAPAPVIEPVSIPMRESPADELPGPKYSRQDLEVLASGKISSVFGPFFERQDGYARQTRMPEPPFLLADRVTGIDAEAGSMATGTIWTETDVTESSWYLHRRHMPGGLMIEAGQADLLLISWLGVDFLNRSERVYRLLGCELTYRGGLPRPGDTLAYDIHVDGHANQGDVRLFFFHYDCRVDGEVRLEVRHGQAGFFTDLELAESAGVLWDPLEETPPVGRLDPPRALPEHRSFSPEQLVAFSEGRVGECMGPGFELCAPHTLTPTIQTGRMLLLDQITDFEPEGGPWRRGYLRATTAVGPESWIYQGHFKNDPCMPGTLMLEGCFQAMSFYLAALGFTLDRDGWRFEPVPDEAYTMRCRGQVVPASNELVYELFVHEIHHSHPSGATEDGPLPTLHADLLCTVDGLKAFHARRLGLRLVPDWPLSTRPAMLDQPFPGGERPQGRRVAEVDGFRFDYPSLLACAWGRPSDAFGEMYRVFDSPRKVARLPGPPYHFMSRIAAIDGEMGRFTPGAELEAEYDVPPEAWYFSDNGHPTMPFAVLMEVGLQPCGWLASYIGSALTTDIDLQFRNLDGTGTLPAEITPSSGIVKSRVKLTATSSSAGVLIVRFEVEMRDDTGDVFSMQTAFGFFPAEAMANQVGLPASKEERAAFEAPSDFLVDLTARPERYCAGTPRLAESKLLMFDRVNGFWPDAGKAGLGRLRAEKDVDPGEWFFKAHFYTDPVQPGSLGIEAMVQLLQFYMLHTGMADEVDAGPASGATKEPRFEPLAVDQPLTWKYRGQVLPTNRLITTELEIVETGTDERGVYAIANAWLWVDGKRIYSATNLGMRIVGGSGRGGRAAGASTTVTDVSEAPRQATGPAATAEPSEGKEPLAPSPLGGEGGAEPAAGEELLDPAADPWILDHRPTWTLPALPMMSLVDRLAATAQAHLADLKVVGFENVHVERWVAFPDGPVRIRTEVASEERRGSEMGSVEVRLEVWRDAATPALSRFETAASGTVLMARAYCPAPQAVATLENASPVPDPYASGALFHGPAFQLLRRLEMSDAGSSATLDAGGGSVPYGSLHPALLDAATHGIPHDDLRRWCQQAPDDVVAYPQRLRHARFYAPAPETGEVRCEARFERYDAESRTAVCHLQMLIGDTPWADMRLEEVLLPKGPLGLAPADARRAFLRDRIATPGLGLGRFKDGHTRLTEVEVAASDWLPGTVARAYGVSPAADRTALTLEVAIKDHVARHASVPGDIHPATVAVARGPEGSASAVPETLPLTRFDLSISRDQGGGLTINDDGEPKIDLGPVRRYWSDYLGIEDWPVEDVYFGLVERFVRRVVVTDPRGLAAIHGRSTLFLANHQVMIESLLFSIVTSALVGTPTVTLAKAEHRTSWLGQLIAHCFGYPGVRDPEVIVFFEREKKESLPQIIQYLGRRMMEEPRSVSVHCEGTRSLTCRQPVVKLSSAFVDLAMKAGIAIVPVRFTGGLPAEPLAQRIPFPLGHGRQDYWLGSPITPEQLAAMEYKDRRASVVDAINALGPKNDEERPNPPDPDFEAEVGDWVARTGATPEHAAIYKTLEQLEHPGREVRRLIEAARSGRLLASDDAKGRWLVELARRLFGERGPRIDIQSTNR